MGNEEVLVKDQPATPGEMQASVPVPAKTKGETVQEDTRELFSGEDLRAVDVGRIMDSSPTRMIVVAGAADAGKTTLLLTIMHQFYKGGFGDYIFAASRTLLAFDRRAFDSNIISGRVLPTTQHTISSLEDIKFLHLAVRNKNLSGPITNLLFTDISGENFRDASDSVEECRKLWVLRRADRFVLLFDGNKIADPAERQKAKVEGIMLLMRCVEAEMIGRKSKIDIMFTKQDILETCADKERALPFVDEIRAETLNKFRSSLGSISFHSVAARPTMKPKLGETYGFKEFLPAWIDESPFIRGIEREILNASPENSRMFVCFGNLRREL